MKLCFSGSATSMAGSCRILHLVALVSGVNGLLTRKTQAPCSNSDGLTGYSFSHKGLWIPGYTLIGTGFTKWLCSAECSKRTGCVGFSGSFKEDGGNGGCYTYAATTGSVASASDRAYKKCPGAETGAASLPKGVTAMHLVARKNVTANGTTATTANGTTVTIDDLYKQAEGMEMQLANVSKTVASVDVRMRRLKSLLGGTSGMLTDAGRIAAAVSKTALTNRGGLLAIGRARVNINATFAAINSSSTLIMSTLKRIGDRGKENGGGSDDKEKGLAALEPNVTHLEKQLGQLNDPATQKELDALVGQYQTFENGITTEVKTVLHTNLRGLVDTQREALHNYTTALQGSKKDPCCCKDAKVPSAEDPSAKDPPATTATATR